MDDQLATRRAERSLTLSVRQAALHATQQQRDELDRLLTLRDLDLVTTEQARTLVAHLRRQQAA